MPGPLFKARSKRDLVKKLQRMGYSGDEARLMAEANYEGRGYYYVRGGGYIVRFSSKRDFARGRAIGRGRWRHTFDPIVEAAVKLTEEAVEAAEGIAGEITAKQPEKPVTGESILRRAFPREKFPREVREAANYVWENLSERVKRAGRWTYMTVLNIVKMLFDWAEEKGVDPEKIDVLGEFDWNMGYQHVKNQVMEKLMKTLEEKYYGVTDEDIRRMMEAYENASRFRMEGEDYGEGEA